MTFLLPQWFWLLLVVGLLLLYKRNRGHGFNWSMQKLWLMAALLFVVAALARPVLPGKPADVDQTGSDVVIAVDLSYSMQADDIAPTRLEAAKKLLRELVKRDTKDRFGVIGFTTNAIVLSPLTNDGELLLHLFDGLDEQMIITQGTRLLPALKLARKMSRAVHPKLLLLSDGGDELGYNEEAAYAKENNLQVNVIMLATHFGSTLKKRDGSMLKDKSGDIVVTSRNDAIRALASATKGAFIDGADLEEVLDVLHEQNSEDFRSKTKVMQYTELFYYFIIAAIIAFMMAVTTLGKMFRKRMLPLLMLLGISSQAGVLDYFYLEKGRSAYGAQKYAVAADAFGKVQSRYARYNTANSLYKEGEYEKALQLYKAVRSSDPDVKASLYFNMGNCYIRLQEFTKAREMFVNSLILRDDPEARENLYAIIEAEEQDHLLTGRQEGKEREQQSTAESSNERKAKKRGGGSNMKVAADSSQGGGDEGKKTKSDPRMSFSGGKARLSSRQYELINQRSVDEAKPW